jgi:integrase/recombinase XerD
MHTTTTEVIALFEKALVGSNYSPHTIRAYADDVKQFITFLQTRKVDWDIPTRLVRIDIVEFINYLAAQKATGVTRFRKLASLRKFFRFLQENEIIYGCPTDTIKSPLKEEKDPQVSQKNEYKALLFEARKNTRDFAILQTFLQTGIRVGELARLTIGDVDLENKNLHVRQGKGRKDRSIPLEEQTILVLTKLLKGRVLFPSDEPVFLSRYGTALTVRAIRKMVKKYLKRAGISKKASVHTLRHTFGTHKVDRGMTLPALQELLGHKKMETTYKYVHLAKSSLRQQQENTAL